MSVVWMAAAMGQLRVACGLAVSAPVTMAVVAYQFCSVAGSLFDPRRYTSERFPRAAPAMAPYTLAAPVMPRLTSFDHVTPLSFEELSHGDQRPPIRPLAKA